MTKATAFKKETINALQGILLLGSLTSALYWTHFTSGPPKTSSEATLLWLLPIFIPTAYASLYLLGYCEFCIHKKSVPKLTRQQAIANLVLSYLASATLMLPISNVFWTRIVSLWRFLKPYGSESGEMGSRIRDWIVVPIEIVGVWFVWIFLLAGAWLRVRMNHEILEALNDHYGEDVKMV